MDREMSSLDVNYLYVYLFFDSYVHVRVKSDFHSGPEYCYQGNPLEADLL